MLKLGTLILVAAVLLSCAKVRHYQTACESQYAAFPAMVACLKGKIAQDRRMQSSQDTDLVRLYVTYADAAAAKVISGDMTEVDAKLALAELYTRLTTIEDERQATRAQKSGARAVAYGTFLQGLATYEPKYGYTALAKSGSVVPDYSSRFKTYNFRGNLITCADTGYIVTCF